MFPDSSRSIDALSLPFRRYSSNWRAAFLLTLFATLVVSCAEDQVGPGEFTAQASFTVILPNQGGTLVPVASLHLRLFRAGDSEAAAETTIDVTGQQDTIEASLTVPLDDRSDEFTVSVTLFDEDGATVFIGEVVSLTLESEATGQEATIAVAYVGKGSEASTVEIISSDSVVAAGDTVTLTAAAKGSDGEVIVDTPIRWRSTDAARASFVSETPGRLVAGPGTGDVEVLAELLTGPADTTSVRVTVSTQSLLAEAIDSLEAALFLAVTEILEADDVDFTNLDLFSFAASRQLFEEALAGAPDNQIAAFGLAVTTVLSLEDDPDLSVAADEWELWLEDNDGIDDLTGGGEPFPPTLEEQQDLLLNPLKPALVEALDLLGSLDDPEFAFTVTARMQGRNPGEVDDRELDLTDVVALRALIETTIAAIEIANAIEATPTPYGPAGFAAAMAEGSVFGTIAAGGNTRLADARDRLLHAVALALEGLDRLQAESDDQSDDIIKYDPGAAPGFDDFDDFVGATDVQRARDVLSDVDGILQGPYLLLPDIGLGLWRSLREDVSADLSKFLTDPVADLKTLIPDYEISDGDFHWAALAFDEWTMPDPTFDGVLPGIGSTDDLKARIDLEGAWDAFRHSIDEWQAFTQSPNDGDIFAISDLGNLFEVSADLTTGTDRPDAFSTDYAALIGNAATSELVAMGRSDGILYTRPDDDDAGWTRRLTLDLHPMETLAESPAGNGSMFVAANGEASFEIPSDFSGSEPRPAVFVSSPSLVGNRQRGDLVMLTSDGRLFSRPPDESTPWTEHIQLPDDSPFGRHYVAIDEVPSGGDMYAVTSSGAVERINSTLSASGARPRVPASSVVSLISNSVTGELLALTPDGRIFSRPDDLGTPWILRLTLPRTILP